MSLKNSDNDKSQINPIQPLEGEEDDEKLNKAPIDREFEVGLIENRIVEPKLILPNIKDTLFVTKQISKYEPMKSQSNLDSKTVEFKPDPNQQAKKRFSSLPKNHGEHREVCKELTPE